MWYLHFQRIIISFHYSRKIEGLSHLWANPNHIVLALWHPCSISIRNHKIDDKRAGFVLQYVYNMFYTILQYVVLFNGIPSFTIQNDSIYIIYNYYVCMFCQWYPFHAWQCIPFHHLPDMFRLVQCRPQRSRTSWTSSPRTAPPGILRSHGILW